MVLKVLSVSAMRNTQAKWPYGQQALGLKARGHRYSVTSTYKLLYSL